MKKEDLISYSYDFLSLLLQSLDSKIIRNVILFGSVSRGDFDKESDIDLFIDVYNEKNSVLVEKTVEKTKFDFEKIKEKKWGLRNIDFVIRCTIGNLLSKKWGSMRRSIISSGIVLYGKFVYSPDKLSHYTLVNYDLSHLKRKNKMVVIRKLFGYKNVKGNKIYKRIGIVEELNGNKIRGGLFIVPTEKFQEIFNFLKKSGVKFKIQEIWGEESIKEI